MPSNIEIKARVDDPARVRLAAERLSGGSSTIIAQHDTFFPCLSGRLKLRELSRSRGELIAYTRPDAPGSKQSDYSIFSTDNPHTLRTVLESALGTSQIVRKTRHLFLVGQTRIHLDDVTGLGWFLELEVVLSPGQRSEEAHAVADALMVELGVAPADLISGAYADLLAEKGS